MLLNTWVIVTLSSSLSLSSCGVTVTVCAVAQLIGVKVSTACPPAVPPSPCTFTVFASPLVAVTVTSAVGARFSTTV